MRDELELRRSCSWRRDAEACRSAGREGERTIAIPDARDAGRTFRHPENPSDLFVIPGVTYTIRMSGQATPIELRATASFPTWSSCAAISSMWQRAAVPCRPAEVLVAHRIEETGGAQVRPVRSQRSLLRRLWPPQLGARLGRRLASAPQIGVLVVHQGTPPRADPISAPAEPLALSLRERRIAPRAIVELRPGVVERPHIHRWLLSRKNGSTRPARDEVERRRLS